MKRLVVLVLMSVFVISGISCKKQKEIVREGLVNFVSGEVYLMSAEKKNEAKVGDVVTQGMKIITGSKSVVDIYFGENAVKVLENTVVEVRQLVTNLESNSEQTKLFIEKGETLSKITKKLSKSDEYVIQTPTTIAAIRGTDFMVSELGNKARVSCLDGKVVVKDATVEQSEYVEVNAGEEVEVDPGKPLNVKELDAANKQRIQNILKDIKEMQQDIRKRFEEEREKIREQVKDMRKQTKEAVEKQRAEDLQRVEDQKALDKANIDAIKGTADKGKEEAKEAVDSLKGDTAKSLEGVKPEVKKFSVDVKKPTIEKESIDKPAVEKPAVPKL